jgi:hypothetical protein
LGECGNKNYSCGKCGGMVKTQSYPNSGSCPNGSSHNWSSL